MSSDYADAFRNQLRVRRSLAAAALLALFLLPAAAAAQAADAAAPAGDAASELTTDVAADVAAETADAAAAPDPALIPAETPSPDEMDRIEIGRGEILLGTIERIQDGTLYFDSDELDGLELDIDDVRSFRSERAHTYRFVGREIVSGTAVLDGDTIRIRTSTGVIERPRSDIVAMIEGRPTELNYWSGDVGIGFAVRTGNTEQSDLTLSGRLTRRTALTRFDNRYSGTFSSQGGAETANNHRFTTSLDLYLTRRFFVTLPTVEIYTDKFQNIGLRATPAALLGYDVLANKWVTWDVSGGAGYQYARVDTATAGQPNSTSNAAVILQTNIEVDITSDVEWDTNYRFNLIPTETDLTSHNLTSVLSVDIFGPIDLDAGFYFDRTRRPPISGTDPITGLPTRPESNDFRMTLGFAADF